MKNTKWVDIAVTLITIAVILTSSIFFFDFVMAQVGSSLSGAFSAWGLSIIFATVLWFLLMTIHKKFQKLA